VAVVATTAEAAVVAEAAAIANPNFEPNGLRSNPQPISFPAPLFKREQEGMPQELKFSAFAD
jgi:hypothetical protein